MDFVSKRNARYVAGSNRFLLVQTTTDVVTSLDVCTRLEGQQQSDENRAEHVATGNSRHPPERAESREVTCITILTFV